MFLKRAAFVFFVLCPLSVVRCPTAFAKITKLDPLIRQWTTDSGQRTTNRGVEKALSLNPDGRLQVDCFVVVYNPAKSQAIANQIESLGGKVRSIIEDVMTAYLPLDSIEEISGWEDVKYIEAGKPMLPKMDTARVATNADKVNNNTGSGRPLRRRRRDRRDCGRYPPRFRPRRF